MRMIIQSRTIIFGHRQENLGQVTTYNKTESLLVSSEDFVSTEVRRNKGAVLIVKLDFAKPQIQLLWVRHLWIKKTVTDQARSSMRTRRK